GYSATLLAYAMLCGRLGGAAAGDPSAVPDRVAWTLDAFDAVARTAADRLSVSSAVDFVGRGMSLAAASEGALMFREALAVPTAAFDTYQYLHGPMEPLRENSGLVVF